MHINNEPLNIINNMQTEREWGARLTVSYHGHISHVLLGRLYHFIEHNPTQPISDYVYTQSVGGMMSVPLWGQF